LWILFISTHTQSLAPLAAAILAFVETLKAIGDFGT
jgi:hypothetical protein